MRICINCVVRESYTKHEIINEICVEKVYRGRQSDRDV